MLGTSLILMSCQEYNPVFKPAAVFTPTWVTVIIISQVAMVTVTLATSSCMLASEKAYAEQTNTN